MDETQTALVKDSWAKVAPIAPTAATLFYDRLFTVAPGVRALFPDDMAEQKAKLMEMLQAVVDGLDDLEGLIPAVRALGRRHAGYGAEPDHYPVVGDCLLWTLGQGLGAAFTPEVEAAWATAYGVLADVMTEAAATARDQAA